MFGICSEINLELIVFRVKRNINFGAQGLIFFQNYYRAICCIKSQHKSPKLSSC